MLNFQFPNFPIPNFQFLLPLLVLFAACAGDGKRDIEAYYYQPDEMLSGKVYEYQSVGAGEPYSEYWYCRASRTDTGTFLTSVFYDSNFQVGQIVREKIVANGSLARNLLLYEPDYKAEQLVKIEANIESANVFPFEVSDSGGVFLFKLNYRLPSDSSAKIYLIRNRKFAGDAPEFEFRGKKHPCIRFTLREIVGHEAEGSLETEAFGEERYAEGLGLVYFRKEYGSGAARTVREFQLADIYPMEILEQKARSGDRR